MFLIRQKNIILKKIYKLCAISKLILRFKDFKALLKTNPPLILMGGFYIILISFVVL